MADYQRTIDDVRSICQSGDQTMRESVRVAAELFADLCREAADRLRRCDDYLRQGLRTEALHLAELEPKLLILITALDFPERPQWDELVSLYDLPVPPAIQFGRAAALNQAYADHQPAQALLRQHRRLAINRAPVGERLAVVRQLGQLEPNNLVWRDELRMFEEARFRELEAELEGRTGERRAAAVTAALEELEHNRWLPPVSERVQMLLSRYARASLGSLAEQLRTAHKKSDASQALRLQGLWQKYAQQVGLGPYDPLSILVEPVFAWLKKIERQETAVNHYQAAVQELAFALDRSDATVDRLADLYEAVARDPQNRKQGGMPRELEERYHERIDQIQARSSRRDNLIFATVAVLGVAAVVTFLVLLKG